MLNKIASGLAALAAAGFVTSAMAAPTVVDVNIEVTPIVSMWSQHNSINLVMDGSDPGGNGLATAASALAVVNNVDANIKASVTGNLPVPSLPGGGINFFLFPHANAADVATAVAANAYNPAGALVWNEGNLGTEQTLFANTGVTVSTNDPAYLRPITYASDMPGEAVLPGDWNLVVTYTITANP